MRAGAKGGGACINEVGVLVAENGRRGFGINFGRNTCPA